MAVKKVGTVINMAAIVVVQRSLMGTSPAQVIENSAAVTARKPSTHAKVSVDMPVKNIQGRVKRTKLK